jgi:hypothetical protein
MKVRLDKLLREQFEISEKLCRLRRNRDKAACTLVLAEVLCELEAKGDAMRYLDETGQIAWRATPTLGDYIDDLLLDAEADLQGEAEERWVARFRFRPWHWVRLWAVWTMNGRPIKAAETVMAYTGIYLRCSTLSQFGKWKGPGERMLDGRCGSAADASSSKCRIRLPPS